MSLSVRLPFAIPALALVGAPLISACTGAAQPGASHAPSAQGAPASGGTVTIPIGADPTLNPWSPNAFVQLRPSDAVVQLSARAGAGARSFPGLVTPAKITRLMKSDSTNAFGLHGFSVGSAPIGIVTVPPEAGAPCVAAVPDAAG